MPPAGVIPEEDLNMEEKEDEILVRAGVEDLPFPSALRWKILVVIGAVVTVLGFLLGVGIAGFRLPTVDFLGGALVLSLAIFLVILGLAVLIGGIVLFDRNRRDPYDMKPIR